MGLKNDSLQSTAFSFIDSWVCASNHKPFKILDEVVPA